MFELILDASSAGWHGRLLPPRRKKQPLPAPYDPSTSEKVWYFSRSRASIPHLYLRLLLDGQQIVPHEGGTDAYMQLTRRLVDETQAKCAAAKPRPPVLKPEL